MRIRIDLSPARHFQRELHEACRMTVGVGFSGDVHPPSGMAFAKLASIHQHGAPSRKLPARPILVEPPEWEREAAEEAQAFVPDVVKNPDRGIRKMLLALGCSFSRWLRERFRVFSHGSGNWAPLAPSTVARKKARHASPLILRDTHTLFRALTPGNPGNFIRVNK